MTSGPQTWCSDPAVEAGFAAAYAGPEPRSVLHVHAQGVTSLPDASEPGPVVTAQDERDLLADLAARRLVGAGRRVRAGDPSRLSPARALAGAAVSVAGVCLGIGTLLWASDDPSQGSGPAVTRPVGHEPVGTQLAGQQPVQDLIAAAPVPAAPASSVAASASQPASAASLRTPVTVLNNSNLSGLADRAAVRFRKGGWQVRLTGDFRGRIPVTTVYYDPGLEASARAFAADFAGIIRVRPRFATLPAHGVVVVLTRDYAV